MTLAYLIVCPYEAVAIGRIASYVFPQMNSIELYRVGDYPVYLPHLATGLALTAVIVLINYRGVHISATFQNLTTFGLLAIFAVVAVLVIAMKVLPSIPGSFGPLEYLALGVWIVIGYLLWKRRRSSSLNRDGKAS